jgi:hypothetical protein
MNVSVTEFLKLSNPNSSITSIRKISELGENASKILNLKPWHIGKTLYYFRKSKKMTQADICELTNFQLSSVSLRESRRYNNKPTMKTIEIYCSAFDITLEMFMEKLLSIIKE